VPRQYSQADLVGFLLKVENLTAEDANRLAGHVWHVLAAEIPSKTPRKSRTLTLKTMRSLLNDQRIAKKLWPGYRESLENWMKTLR